MTKTKRGLLAITAVMVAVFAFLVWIGFCYSAPSSAFAEEYIDSATGKKVNTWKSVPNITRWTYGSYSAEAYTPTAEPTYGGKEAVKYAFYKMEKIGDDEYRLDVDSRVEDNMDGFRVAEDYNRVPAGRYAMEAAVEETAEYTGLHSFIYLNIFQATNRWVKFPNVARWTEGEEPNLPTAEPLFGKAEFEIYKINDYKNKIIYYSTSRNINRLSEMKAGWYTLAASATGNSNYTGIGVAEYDFRVFAAPRNAWKVTPNITGWTEGENPNRPVGTALYTDGTPVEFRYKALGAADDTATVAVPTKAGKYVMIAVARTEGYVDLTAEVTFTIERPALGINSWTELPTLKTWTEGETPNEPHGAAKEGEVIFAYEAPDGRALNGIPTTAGEYVLVATAVAPGYEILTVKVPFTVAANTASALKTNAWENVPNIQGWTEGKKANNPVGTAKAGTVTFSYKKADGTRLNERPNTAGDYVLVATAEAEGYETLTAEVGFTVTDRIASGDNAGWIAGICVLSAIVLMLIIACAVLKLQTKGIGIKDILAKIKGSGRKG